MIKMKTAPRARRLSKRKIKQRLCIGENDQGNDQPIIGNVCPPKQSQKSSLPKFKLFLLIVAGVGEFLVIIAAERPKGASSNIIRI